MLFDDTSKRNAPDPWDIGFGVVVLVGALLALFVWFPADIPTGFFFTNAIGREEPGDAFFPIMLAVLLAILSVIQLALAIFKGKPVNAEPSPALKLQNFKFLAIFILISLTGFAIMYWLGPLVVSLLNAIGTLDATYRQLTDTAPYKYIGYVVGGFAMSIALIAWTEGQIRPRSVFTVLLTLVVAIIIFDVVLKNVLLPPNADF